MAREKEGKCFGQREDVSSGLMWPGTARENTWQWENGSKKCGHGQGQKKWPRTGRENTGQRDDIQQQDS